MEIFSLTLNQMLYFFTLIVVGYAAKKFKVFSDGFDMVVSRYLSFIVTPAMIIENFYQKFKIDILKEKMYLLLIACVTVFVLFVCAVNLSKLFTKDSYIRKIYTYSLTNANFGYMGYVLIEALFGADALFNMIIFTIPCNIYAFTIGINSFNPDMPKFTFKSLLTPVTVALIAGAVLGLSGIVLPEFVSGSLSGISKTMGPLAMIVTGFIIAKYKFLDIIVNCRIYLASLLRLIIIPSVVVLALKALNIDNSICMIALCTTAMPFGLNGVIFPAAYGQDTKTGASMALISDILAIITIPLLFSLFL